MGHILMANRNGVVVDSRVTHANGTAEREAALPIATSLPGNHRITLGADKGYDTQAFVADLCLNKATPHAAQKKHSRIDGRATRHAGYANRQKILKRVEEVFGWMKTIGLFRKSKFRGEEKVDWLFTLTAATYNMTRMRNLVIVASG